MASEKFPIAELARRNNQIVTFDPTVGPGYSPAHRAAAVAEGWTAFENLQGSPMTLTDADYLQALERVMQPVDANALPKNAAQKLSAKTKGDE